MTALALAEDLVAKVEQLTRENALLERELAEAESDRDDAQSELRSLEMCANDDQLTSSQRQAIAYARNRLESTPSTDGFDAVMIERGIDALTALLGDR